MKNRTRHIPDSIPSHEASTPNPASEKEHAMKKIIYLAALLIGIGVTVDANMITNPGFESSGTNGQPIDWTAVTTTNITMIYSPTGGNPGAYAGLSASGASGTSNRYWKQVLSVLPNTTYSLSFDYKTNCDYSDVRIDLWNGPGEVGWVGLGAFGDKTIGPYASLTQVASWTHWSGSVPYPNTFTTGATVNYITVKLQQNANWGNAVFDNVTLAPVPEPFSLALLGLGIGVMAMRRRR